MADDPIRTAKAFRRHMERREVGNETIEAFSQLDQANIAWRDDLAKSLRDMEAQLQELDLARQHPRWTQGGELVLMGDYGIARLTLPDDRPAVELYSVVTGIDAMTATVWILTDWEDGKVLSPVRYTHLHQLVERGRKPRAMRLPGQGEQIREFDLLSALA